MKIKSFITILLMVQFVMHSLAQTGKSNNAHRVDGIKRIETTQGIKELCNPGRRIIIDSSNDGKERQFPFVYKFRHSIFVSYSEHKDAKIASPVDAMMISRDNGKTWNKKLTNSDFFISSMVEKDGKLYGVVYFTYPISSQKEKMVYWTSVDRGETWIKYYGVVNSFKGKQFKSDAYHGIWSSMLFHRGMQVMPDGSIQGLMYGQFEGDKKYTVVRVKSTDDCKTWDIVSVVASGTPDEFPQAQGYCEPTFAKVKDGSILCVMRIGSYLPLFQCRSRNGGETWSKPTMLPGLNKIVSQSVDPHLLLMKNGTLALTYGRPGDRIAFSTDGSGYNWDEHCISYSGETTGYTGIVEPEAGKILLIADQGRTGAKQMAIWAGIISLNKKEKK